MIRWRNAALGMMVTAVLSSCVLFQGKAEQAKYTGPGELELPSPPATWEKVLDRTTLPILQTNLGGDASREWRYANAVLGAEVWVADDANLQDDFVQNPELLNLPVTATGWPRELPPGLRVQVSTYYSKRPERAPGELRNAGKNEWGGELTESLTGLYVITWKGRTLPDEEGRSQLSLTDTTNDSDPEKGTVFLAAGEDRMIALVRDPDRGIQISYRQPDPADPVRDIKIWTPREVGAGLSVDISSYNPEVLGPGKLSAWNLEPGPGQPDPLWHPKYLDHVRSDPSGVLRFMGLLNINSLTDESSLAWSDRTSDSVTLGSLVGVDSNNYIRHPQKNFKNRVGIAYERLIDLCNTVEKDLWIQVAHTATQDHIAGLAALAARTLHPGLRVWFEYSNEIWNTYSPYLPQYNAGKKAGEARGQSQGWGSGFLQGQALKTFEAAWYREGGSDARLVNVLSGFAASSDYNREVLRGASSVGPQLAEDLAVTTYFGHSLTGQLHSLSYGNGKPGEEVYREAYEMLRSSLYRDFETWSANSRLARESGVGLIAYEGGSHILATGYGDWNNPDHAAFMNFLENLHKHPLMGDLYKEHWALWSTAGGRTASLFVDIGGYGYYGYWGAKEDVTEIPDESPRWKAAQDFALAQKGVRDSAEPLGAAPALQAQRSFRGEVGELSEIKISAAGGDGALSLSVLGGNPPRGMDLTAEPGLLSLTGTPEKMGLERFVVRVLDSDGDPDYGIFSVAVDPKGTSSGRLLLFDPGTVPLAALAQSEDREDYRSRFDIHPRVMTEDIEAMPPRMFLSFDPEEPLFTRHYIDGLVTNNTASALTPSGGWVMTYGTEDLLRQDSVTWNPEEDSPLLWIGLRDKALTGRMGSSQKVGNETVGVPTRMEVLLLWRREQLEAAAGEKVRFGSGLDESALVLESGGIASDTVSIRFVIRNRNSQGQGEYFVSEAQWKEPGAGTFELTDFNNSGAAGKRWAPFVPASGAFSIQDDFVNPEGSALAFGPVDFNDVDGIGFVIQAYRSGWHYDFRMDRFLAVGLK